MRRRAALVALLAVALTACDQLFHVRTGTLVYRWDPQVADQTILVPLTFAAAAAGMLVAAASVGVVRGGSVALSGGLAVTAYLASGLLPAGWAAPYAAVLVGSWVVRIAVRGQVARLALLGVAVAAGGVLGEAVLSAAGEFDYAHPDVLGVPWWLFGLYLHGSLVGVDLVHRLRDMPPSTGSMTPVRKLAAGESRNAAAAPNSSGSP